MIFQSIDQILIFMVLNCCLCSQILGDHPELGSSLQDQGRINIEEFFSIRKPRRNGLNKVLRVILNKDNNHIISVD